MRRIRQISVKRLFGIFDHVIPLNMEDHITIIHGPNGFGKTIILRLLSELFSQNDAELSRIPFDEFRVDLDDDSSIVVTRSLRNDAKSKGRRVPLPEINFCVMRPGCGPQNFPLTPVWTPQTLLRELSPARLEVYIPNIIRVESHEWMDLSTKEVLSLEEVLDRFGDYLPIPRGFAEIPDELKEFRQLVVIHFVEAQRLLSTIDSKSADLRRSRSPEERGAMGLTVTKYAQELALAIKAKISESATLSQSLDKTFPQRVFEPTPEQRNMTEGELRKKLADQNQTRSQLMRAGLLAQDDNPGFQIGDQIEESQRIMLSVYVEDVDKKLSVFDEIAAKINLFQSVINKRFLYKEITINSEEGFVFTTKEGKKVPLDKLSSGEQNELVLFYNLLFKTAERSLILIDEPELSLHVAWQIEFLEDLQEIIHLTNIDLLIATHSPEIIHDRWDLTVRLEGPRK